MPEKTVIEECIKGNLQSFRVLVSQSVPLAFPVAFRMTGSRDEAADIVQESMVAVWKGIHSLRSAGSYKSWMYRIVVNKCYDSIRRRNSRPEFRADGKSWELIAERLSEPALPALETEEQAMILAALTEQLSPKQKAVFILSELVDLSNEEIAEISGMSRANVKANLHHARKRISELIVRHGLADN